MIRLLPNSQYSIQAKQFQPTYQPLNKLRIEWREKKLWAKKI